MREYPNTLSEELTLEMVSQGRSIARYGDGEFALAEGRSIRNQRFHPLLSARLRQILNGDDDPCLVGIPNIQSPTPKAPYWEKYKRCARLLNPHYSYGSSFISRPDNAPWLDTPSYWANLEALWAGKDVTLVRGTDPTKDGTGAVSLTVEDLRSARSVREVVGPHINAWHVYDALLEQIGTPSMALLCLGATATVMAADLCKKGVHAIDIGHVGMFIHRHQAGEPMQRKKRVA